MMSVMISSVKDCTDIIWPLDRSVSLKKALLKKIKQQQIF